MWSGIVSGARVYIGECGVNIFVAIMQLCYTATGMTVAASGCVKTFNAE